MVWKEIKKKVHDWANDGTTLEGRLVEIVPSMIKGKDYIIEKANKELVLVYGLTVLSHKLDSIPIGTVVKIQYLGRKKSQKTKQEYDDFQVFQWDGTLDA